MAVTVCGGVQIKYTRPVSNTVQTTLRVGSEVLCNHKQMADVVITCSERVFYKDREIHRLPTETRKRYLSPQDTTTYTQGILQEEALPPNH